MGICTAHQIFWQNHRNLFKCLLIKYVHAPSILSAEWCQFNCLILANLSQNQKLWKILIDHKKNQGEVNSIIEKPDKSECRPIHFKFWFTIQKNDHTGLSCELTANNSEWWTNGDLTLVSCQKQSCNAPLRMIKDWTKSSGRFSTHITRISFVLIQVIIDVGQICWWWAMLLMIGK